MAFVLLQSDRFWPDFCRRLDRQDLITDERFADAAARFTNRVKCIEELRMTFEAHDLLHWERRFTEFQGVWDVLRTAHEVHADPQAIANGYLPRTTDANGNDCVLVASPVQFDETSFDLT
ncbi:CoA transferase, partial [Mycobacterium avium]